MTGRRASGDPELPQTELVWRERGERAKELEGGKRSTDGAAAGRVVALQRHLRQPGSRAQQNPWPPEHERRRRCRVLAVRALEAEVQAVKPDAVDQEIRGGVPAEEVAISEQQALLPCALGDQAGRAVC